MIMHRKYEDSDFHKNIADTLDCKYTMDDLELLDISCRNIHNLFVKYHPDHTEYDTVQFLNYAEKLKKTILKRISVYDHSRSQSLDKDKECNNINNNDSKKLVDRSPSFYAKKFNTTRLSKSNSCNEIYQKDNVSNNVEEVDTNKKSQDTIPCAHHNHNSNKNIRVITINGVPFSIKSKMNENNSITYNAKYKDNGSDIDITIITDKPLTEDSLIQKILEIL